MSALTRLLHPLSKDRQALLLTIMTYGGSQYEEFFDYLPDEEHDLLKEKAEALAEVPVAKRVPILIRELRELAKYRPIKGLDGVDVSWLIAGLRGESARTIAVVLMHMPSSIVREITMRLPESVQKAMPRRDSLQAIPMDVIKKTRAFFNTKFETMPVREDISVFSFLDLVTLDAKDLVVMVRAIGVDELACAFVVVGRRAMAELLRRLPERDGDEILAALQRVTEADKMDNRSAELFLAKVLVDFHSTNELFQKAGLYRLARSLQGRNFLHVQQLAQRFPRAHGRLLVDFLRQLEEKEIEDNENLAHLKDQIMDTVFELSRRGKIDDTLAQEIPKYETRASSSKDKDED